MKDIKEVYPNANEDGYFYPEGGYTAMTNSFGFETLLEKDGGQYQGDTWIIFKDGDKYGFLQYGWGSCSGCDAFQACHNYEELEALRQRLFNSIQWKDSREELYTYMVEKDWKLDWNWHEKAFRAFWREAIILLSNGTHVFVDIGDEEEPDDDDEECFDDGEVDDDEDTLTENTVEEDNVVFVTGLTFKLTKK